MSSGNSTCTAPGFCKRLAPEFKKMAERFDGWHNLRVVKVPHPLTHLEASEGIRVLTEATPGLWETQTEPELHVMVREQLLYGAFLCNGAFSRSRRGLHHAICETLASAVGGDAEAKVHACVLPHSLEIAMSCSPRGAARVARAFGGAPGRQLAHLLPTSIRSLREVGFLCSADLLARRKKTLLSTARTAG